MILAPGMIRGGPGRLNAPEAAELQVLPVPSKLLPKGVFYEDFRVVDLDPFHQPVKAHEPVFEGAEVVGLVDAEAGIEDLVAAVAEDRLMHVHPTDRLRDRYPVLRPIVEHLLPRRGLVGLERLGSLSFPLRLQLLLDPAVQRGAAPAEALGTKLREDLAHPQLFRR